MANLTCMALNCTSSSRNNQVLRFYYIPANAERRKEWIIACKRTDLLDKPASFFKHKYVCGLHFMNLPAPPLHWSGTSRDSCTQTWESMKFLSTTPDLSELPGIPELKKIEVRTSHTQTEEFILCSNRNLEVMKENETKLTEEETDEAASNDSDQKLEDETSEMSIDEFLQLNEELEKKNIPQTPTKQEANSTANSIRLHKGTQTNKVIIYKIPKNNKCFQQCLRCGKNASRLAPKKEKPDHLITLEEFETASERFLPPEFCATVKNKIKIEQKVKKKRKHQKKNVP